MIIDKDNFSVYTNLLLEAQKINYDETLEEVIIAKLESWEFKNFLKLRCVRTEDIEKDIETFCNIQYELHANNDYYRLKKSAYTDEIFESFRYVFDLLTDDSLTAEILEIYEDLEGLPTKYKEKLENMKIIPEVMKMNNLIFIENNFKDINYHGNEEIIDILKTCILNVKNEDQCRLLIRMVDWFKPARGAFEMNKQGAFICAVFDTDSDFWNRYEDIIKETFYNVDFEFGYEKMYQLQITDEANHISRMQKMYPLYRHD